MAVTAGTGGSGTVDATGDYIFNATGDRDAGATSIQIWNENTTQELLVRAVGVHDAGAELSLPKSKTTVIRFGDQGIRQVFCSAPTSTCEVHWGVVAKTGGAF